MLKRRKVFEKPLDFGAKKQQNFCIGVVLSPKTASAFFIARIMNAHDRRVYAIVLERASQAGYPQCEKCGHNGTKHKLEMRHHPSKQMGGRKNATTPETVFLWCYACHRRIDHGERIR